MGLTGPSELRQRRRPLKEVNLRTEADFGSKLKDNLQESLKDMKQQFSPDALKAQQFYLKYNDWPSETEKTDYTYSRLSKYKDKEVAPGYRLRPNMSRSPIKPSTPNSLYNYTAELEQQKQFYLSATSQNSYRRLTFEDSNEVDSPVISSTWRLRIVNFLITIYTTMMSSVTTSLYFVANTLYNAFALVASASRTSLTAVTSFWQRSDEYYTSRQGIGANSSMFSSAWKGANASEVSQQEQNGIRGVIMHTITRFWSWTVTTTTTVITSVANMPRRVTSNNYWWLLFLLPLLLVGLWWLISEDSDVKASALYITRSAQTLISALPSYIGGLLESLSSPLSAATSSFISSVASLFTGFISIFNDVYGLVSNLYLVITESAIWMFSLGYDYLFSAFNYLKSCMCFLSSSLIWWYSFFGTLLTNQVSFIWGLFPNVTESAITDHVPVYESASSTEFNHRREVVADHRETEAVLKSEELTRSIDKLQKKVADMERRLQNEVAGWKSAESGYLENLNSYRQSLLINRASAEAASRRCCRWPCSIPPSKDELTSISTRVSNEVLAGTVAEIRQRYIDDLEKLKAEIRSSLATRLDGTQSIGSSVDLDEIQRIISAAISLYDADKTGRADYALETGGARVVSIRCTKTYSRSSPIWNGILGNILYWDKPSAPEFAIRPGMTPGECWAFQGSVGYLALELSYSVYVTGFTMEHISASLSPTGKIDSAPQHFEVWGLNSADDIYDQYLFGTYVYKDNGQVIQYFPVLNPINKMFKFVELKIISNHGHPDYTCLYRIRVHGTVT